MKKLFLIGFALISIESFSQKLMDKLYFGLKVGGNYSNLIDVDDASFKTEGLAGFQAGAIVGFKLTNTLQIQQEFLYSTQGAKIEVGNFAGKEVKLSYVAVPILLKYHSLMGIYVEAGPQVNILTKDFEDSGFDSFAEKTDAGAALGMGYQFRVGPVKGLGIGARYYHGFTKVTKLNSSTTNNDFVNSVVQGSIFYIF
jgi:hypothetical protein